MATNSNVTYFVNLYERIIFNGKIIYQKIDESCLGYFASDSEFVIISGKYMGISFNTNASNANYRISTMRTISHLTNGDKFSNKHLDAYKSFPIGTYCYLTESKNFCPIQDTDILQALNANNTSDISKMFSQISTAVISQDEPIKQILTSLYKNQRVIRSKLGDSIVSRLKENIIIYGPTGTGKTEILKQIAELYDVPIVIEDATSLSETGFVGRSVPDMLNDLYLASNKNISQAQHGILVIDEFDKLGETSDGISHVSREGVQRSLLKLLDGSTYYLKDIEFDTSKLTVVAIGAFSKITSTEDYSKLSFDDFIKYGIMRELMGRFSKYVAMNPLTIDDILKILTTSSISPLKTYGALFKEMDIEFSYTQDYIEEVARKAFELGSGARSLKTMIDSDMTGFLYDAFSGNTSQIVVDKINTYHI